MDIITSTRTLFCVSLCTSDVVLSANKSTFTCKHSMSLLDPAQYLARFLFSHTIRMVMSPSIPYARITVLNACFTIPPVVPHASLGIDRQFSRALTVLSRPDLLDSIFRNTIACVVTLVMLYFRVSKKDFAQVILGQRPIHPSGLYYRRSPRAEAIVSRVPTLQHPHYKGE